MAARDGELDRARFRTDRFIHTANPNNGWYVALREGAMLGPYDTRREAEIELVMHMRERGITLKQPKAEDIDLDWFASNE